MDQNNEIAKLFDNVNALPCAEFSARLAGFSQEYVQAISGAVVDYYAALPEDGRFFRCDSMLPKSPDHSIMGWNDWRENAMNRHAALLIPTGYTLLADALLYKAGIRYWLAWLNSLPDLELAAALLLSNPQGKDLLQALDCACGTETYGNVKILLFCALLSEELAPPDRSAFLAVLRKNRSALLELCLEVLADFHYESAHPKNVGICQSIAAICAGQDALSRLSTASPKTTGMICAWAELLAEMRPTAEQLDEFKTAYTEWISGTDDYTLTTTVRGGYYRRELRLLEFVAEAYSSDKSFETELKTLLEKRTYIYHGWTEGPRQQWFLHIGLLLWLMGISRYLQQRDDKLMVYVLKKLNLVIPMVLVDNDYGLLLGNVFCLPDPASPDIDRELIRLIRKIFELPVLCGVAQNYLEHACPSAEVLYALRNRLQTLSELPQRRLPGDPDLPIQRLLEKIKSACGEPK